MTFQRLGKFIHNPAIHPPGCNLAETLSWVKLKHSHTGAGNIPDHHRKDGWTCASVERPQKPPTIWLAVDPCTLLMTLMFHVYTSNGSGDLAEGAAWCVMSVIRKCSREQNLRNKIKLLCATISIRIQMLLLIRCIILFNHCNVIPVTDILWLAANKLKVTLSCLGKQSGNMTYCLSKT